MRDFHHFRIDLTRLFFIDISNIIGQAQICTKNSFLPNFLLQRWIIFVFPCYLARTKNEVEHPWCLSSYGESLCFLSSNLQLFDVRDALQRVNSVMQLALLNYYYIYRGFKGFCR